MKGDKAIRGKSHSKSTCVPNQPKRASLRFAELSECVRVLAPLFGMPTQKSSGTLIWSVLNEYTDFTKLGLALPSNQGAEHQGYWFATATSPRLTAFCWI